MQTITGNAMFTDRTADGFFLDPFSRAPAFRTSLGFPVGIFACDESEGAVIRVSIGYSAFLVGPPILGLFGEVMGLLPAFVFVLVGLFLAGIASSSVKKRLE
ncbi:hypothetical protein [Salibacterium lacus]|uniref:MFS transporter n=1 Tax=Salibacterium lacus TaxID=1898109 RepID=A0ABW5T413_9BACI